MLWNGKECGQGEGHEIPKATVPTTDNDRSKKTGECRISQPFGLLDAILHAKFNLGFPWQKQDTTIRRFMPARWTKFKEESSKVMHLGLSFCCVGTEQLGEYITHTWKLLKCGAGEGLRRLVGLIT